MRVCRRQFLVLSGLALATGCRGGGRASGGVAAAWGNEGLRDGDFIRPRAIGVNGGQVYVIDTTGRVQVFLLEGEFRRMWRVPSAENGTPTAITFRPDGVVVIPDTHYSRILEYSPEADLLKTWGEYGASPGKFIYPTGLALAPDGIHYFSEYGSDFNPGTRVEAERVQVFDRDRQFDRQWGGHGDAPGKFSRAMAIALLADGTVVVADTANHRLQCFAPDGTYLRSIGGPGTEPGQLKFPHDVTIAPDGTILTCEYGTHRISRFQADGSLLGVFGRAGRELGEFNAPRGVCADEAGNVFVADTDNHRIQRFPLEAIA